MASKQSTVDYLVDQMGGPETITSRKMFGEYAIYSQGKVIALVCDDKLFIKPTEGGKKFLKKPIEAPPYPGAKNYFLIPEEMWDERQEMKELTEITAQETPLPKPKKKNKKA